MNDNPSIQEQARPKHHLLSSLWMVAMGVIVLGALVLIDKTDWFVMKPATGTASAMSAASDRASTSAER